jgi:hypothetical protein
MKFRSAISVFALVVPSVLSGQGVKTVARAPLTLPAATPTPTPSSLSSRTTKPAAIQALLDVPVHSPQQLDFPAVWNGQSSRRTFGLSTTGAGAVSAQIPAGPFRIVEFRLMSGPPAPAGSAVVRMAGAARQVEFRQTYAAGQPAPAQWNVGANQDVEIDVVFEPKFDLFSMTAGPKTAAMKVAGPGPKQAWSLSVPMQGMFNGIHIGAIFTVDDKEVQAVSGTARVDVQVRLIGVDTPLKGTVHGQNVPAGVTVGSVPVSVNAAQTVTAKVPVSFAWNALPPDGKNRDVQLVFDVPGHASTASFSVVPVPGTVDAGGQRSDCGIGWLGWSAIIFADGHLLFSLSGNNQDFVNNRDVMGILSVAGAPKAWGIIHLPFDPGGKTTKAYHQWNSANLNSDFDARFNAGDYLAAVRGPVTFSCKLVDAASGKWIYPW